MNDDDDLESYEASDVVMTECDDDVEDGEDDKASGEDEGEYEYSYSDGDDGSEGIKESEDSEMLSSTPKEPSALGLGESTPFSPPLFARESSYEIMDTGKIRAYQSRLIDEVVDVLGVSSMLAKEMLRKSEWNKERVSERWFEDSEKVCKDLGLPAHDDRFMEEEKPDAWRAGASDVIDLSVDDITCPSCYEDVPACHMKGLRCGHTICEECWKQFLSVQIQEKGPASLSTRCPQAKCPYIIPDMFFKDMVSAEAYEKYDAWSINSFVDFHKKVKWCPRPGCNKAVYYRHGLARDIMCSCGHYFCFECSEEYHAPAKCDMAKKWLAKMVDDKETEKWMQARSKACPKCTTPIEVHVCDSTCAADCKLNGRPAMGGCNHTTCKCGHEFCWLCMGAWKAHGGSFYECNTYKEDLKLGKLNAEEEKRAKTIAELKKYKHYFDRFLGHDRGYKARHDIMKVVFERSSRAQDLGLTLTEISFLESAAETIINCRRMLKWTYVFGYYLDSGSSHKTLFEEHQGMVEKYTDQLHETLVDAASSHVHADVASFNEWRANVIRQNKSIGTFVKNVLESVEGFDPEEDRDAIAAVKTARVKSKPDVWVWKWVDKDSIVQFPNSLSNLIESTSSQAKPPKSLEFDYSGRKCKVTFDFKKGRHVAQFGSDSRKLKHPVERVMGCLLREDEFVWNCNVCTYSNPEEDGVLPSHCGMCSAPRS